MKSQRCWFEASAWLRIACSLARTWYREVASRWASLIGVVTTSVVSASVIAAPVGFVDVSEGVGMW